MRAVVVSFDRLPLGFLGCHGNTWIDTPHFDRLAAEGVVFDQHFAECIGPSTSHAWWTGCLQFPARENEVRGDEFAARLAEAGVRSVLLVEEPNSRPVALPQSFDEVEAVGGEDGLDVPHAETPFARLVDRAIERLQSSSGGSELVWLKSRGVPVPWLPPRELAERFVALFEELEDEEDDEPRPTDDDIEWIALEDLEDEEAEAGEELADDDSADVNGDADEEEWEEEPEGEDEEIDEQAEFDELLRVLASVGTMEETDRLDESDWLLVRAVYGGYVSLLDESLGRLRAVVGDDVLLIVTAAEGESLGERIGLDEGPGRLGEEHAHTPLLVRCPGVEGGGRLSEFAQPTDVAPTLLDWFGVSAAAAGCEGRSLLPTCRGDSTSARAAAVSGTSSPTLNGLRTAAFHLVTAEADGELGAESEPRPAKLYVKPEDVWDIHDMADQLPDDADRLTAALDQWVAAARSACPAPVSLLESAVKGDSG